MKFSNNNNNNNKIGFTWFIVLCTMMVRKYKFYMIFGSVKKAMVISKERNA